MKIIHPKNILPKSLMRRFFLAICLMSTLCFSGCSLFGLLAYLAVGDSFQENVSAAYRDLENKTFAVLVAADENTLYEQPNVIRDICQAVSRQIAFDITGVTPIDPKQILAFQTNSAYWSTLPYGALLERFKVQRIVIIDLVQYRLHESGDTHLWRGRAVAHVSIAEDDAEDPNNLGFSTTIQTIYPKDRPLGTIDANPKTFKAGMLADFSRDVSRIFYDHKAPMK